MSVDELKIKGNAAVKQGNFDEAINCYTQAIAIDKDNHILFSNRSNIYLQKGDSESALADANHCIELNSKFGKGYIRKADALLAAGKDEDALHAIEAGINADPADQTLMQKKEAILAELQANFTVQIFGRSEQELLAKMRANPRVVAMMNKDPTLFQRANKARQLPNPMQIMQSDPAIGQLMLELMGLGDKMAQANAAKGENPPGQEEEEEVHYQQEPAAPVKKEEPKKEEPKSDIPPEQQQAETLKNEGNDLFKGGKYDEAIIKYEKAFELHKNICYLNNISTALLKQDKFEEALAKAVEAVAYGRENYGSASFSDTAKALAKQGSALHKLKRYEEAIEKLKESMLEVRDKQTLALLNKVEDELKDHKLRQLFDVQKAKDLKDEGNVLVKANKFVEAAEKFTEGMKHLPVELQDENAKVIDLQLHNNRSLALFKAGQIHASYDDCQFVLTREPDNIKALIRKGQIERIRRQYYLSIETYQEVLRLDPQNAEGYEGYQKTSQKINEMQSGTLSEQEMKEITDIAMNDPDMQKIAQDPGMAQVLQQIQANPQKAQHFLSDPVVSKRLQRLINAGVIRMGKGPQ